MRLFFRRSQRVSGVLKSVPIFTLDARIELANEEHQLVHKYQLQREILYSSEDAKKHAGAMGDSLNQTGFRNLAKAALSSAMYALSLKCTVESLLKGQHIECKDVAELIAAEVAITEAAQTLKGYLEAAVSFDGREQFIEI